MPESKSDGGKPQFMTIMPASPKHGIHGEVETVTTVDAKQVRAAFTQGQKEVFRHDEHAVPEDWDVATIEGMPVVVRLQLICTKVQIPRDLSHGGKIEYTWTIRMTPNPPAAAARFFVEETKQITDATLPNQPMITMNLAQAVWAIAHNLSKTRPIMNSTLDLLFAIDRKNSPKITGWASATALWEENRSRTVKHNKFAWQKYRRAFWPIPSILKGLMSLGFFIMGLPIRLIPKWYEKFIKAQEDFWSAVPSILLKVGMGPKDLRQVPAPPMMDPWSEEGQSRAYLKEVIEQSVTAMDVIWRAVWFSPERERQLNRNGYNLVGVRRTIVDPSMLGGDLDEILTRLPPTPPQDSQKKDGQLDGYDPDLLNRRTLQLRLRDPSDGG